MAKNAPLVLLGYDDEVITDKQKSFIDYTVNKIGGKANWPSSDIIVPLCPLCGLSRPLIVQIYAPLDNSQFHRTLYVFGCVNPICSNQSKGWICIRSQQLEKQYERDGGSGKKQRPEQRQPSSTNISWCTGADEWDVEFDNDDDNAFGNSHEHQQRDDNLNEQNGNVVSNVVVGLQSSKNENRMMSDEEEEESVSMESDPIPLFGNLQLADDKNANCEGQGGGAVGVTNAANAFAEIEGEETEMVTIDQPSVPEQDLIAMLKQTTAVPSDSGDLVLKSYFIAVDEERKHSTSAMANDHIRELVNEYQRKEEKVGKSPSSPGNVAAGGANPMSGESDEKYEKAVPIHGDVMFHNYLERIQENPGQVIRYSRNSLPMLIAPLAESIPKCHNCGNELLCEIQILSTLIPKLTFVSGEPCPIEYGNVLVFTCTKSCWDTPDKMRQEYVIVQREL